MEPTELFEKPSADAAAFVARIACWGVIARDHSAEEVRKAVLDAGLQTVRYGRLSVEDQFERVWGEPLRPKKSNPRAAHKKAKA
jgi:hypothetical protein